MSALSEDQFVFISGFCERSVERAKNDGKTRAGANDAVKYWIEHSAPIFDEYLKKYSSELSELRKGRSGPGFPDGYVDQLSEGALKGREITYVINRCLNAFYPVKRNTGKKKKATGASKPKKQESGADIVSRIRECADKTLTLPNPAALAILLKATSADVYAALDKIEDEGYVLNVVNDESLLLSYRVHRPKNINERLTELRLQLGSIASQIDALLK